MKLALKSLLLFVAGTLLIENYPAQAALPTSAPVLDSQKDAAERATAPSPESALARLSRPVTLASVPDIQQCRGILSQIILDIVNTALEDPAELFERTRRANP